MGYRTAARQRATDILKPYVAVGTRFFCGGLTVTVRVGLRNVFQRGVWLVAIAILCGLLMGIVIYLVQSTYYRRKDQDKYALVKRFERLFIRKTIR